MRRHFCHIIHWLIIRWPWDDRFYWWALPYAGEWAYYWTESPERRREIDSY